MKKILSLFFAVLVFHAIAETQTMITNVEAKQRYPWNGLVDITVTFKGSSNEVAAAICDFSATNSATKAELAIAHVTESGSVSGSGTSWTRKFIWDASADLGEVQIADVALSVEASEPLGGVQLWENGPYWSECNVGASQPEECGYYFWWGDTVGYKRNANGDGWVSAKDGSAFSFTESNCPTYGKDNSSLQSAGYIDSTGNLVAAHDAATAHLGAPWRMPTDAEMSALISNCTTTWTNRNGVAGRLVTGKGDYASKSIFLPAAGYGTDSYLYSLGSSGNVWSSTPSSASSRTAWYLYFTSSNFNRYSYYYRYYGLSVRPLRGFADLTKSVSSGCEMTHLPLDTRTGTRPVQEEETLRYDAGWYANCASVRLLDGSTQLAKGVSGDFKWTTTTCGTHTLKLQALNGSGTVIKTETVERVLDHDEVVTTSAREPTCTVAGCTKGSKCGRCNAVLSTSQTIAALGHNEVVTKEAVPATSVTEGMTEEISCSRCGKVQQAATKTPNLGCELDARQRYPWNGLVDITVTFQGVSNEIAEVMCDFSASNCATRAMLSITHVTEVGTALGSGTTWTRKFIWDASADLGEVKIGDVALVVDAHGLGGVQLWENGPYWAECNVGATQPEEYGYYFWWGDTVGYKRNASNNGWVSSKDGSAFSFSSANCPTYGKGNSSLQSAGYIDSTGNLVAAHDAATAHLGAPWRMPTSDEIDALISNCTTKWTNRNGVAGRLVTGKGEYASKSIFLPAAGLGYDSYLYNLGSYGSFGSSTPDSGNSDYAWNLAFDSSYFLRYYDYRYYGQSVRPLRGFAK